MVRSEGHPVPYPVDDRPRHDLADALFAVTRRWPAVWKSADYHLSATCAVRCFRQRARYLAVTDVADLLHTSASAASRAVDRAVGWGLLAKAPADMDGRYLSVQLTDRGSSYLHDTVRDEQQWLRNATWDWPEQDRAAASHLMLDLVHGLRTVPRPPV
jgi:DNA-binding MarR family transcriptional regulator